MLQRRWPLVLVLALPLAVGLYDRLGILRWVGSTDLTIELVVVDEATGEPIPAAVVEIYGDTQHLRQGNRDPLRLILGAEGCTKLHYPNNTCAGSRSKLGFTDTRSVYLPDWVFWVSAPGYQTTEPTSLSRRDLLENVERTGPCEDRLHIRLPLQKVAER